MKTKIATLMLFLVLATITVGTVTADPVSAAVIQIPAGANSTTIQALIDGANNNDTINFAPGTYNDIKIIINKTLNFVGNGAIINGVNESSTNIFTVTTNLDADASGSTFKEFEFNLLNSNVTVNGKLASTGYAINLDRVSNILIENVTSHNGKAAVYNGNAFNVLINNCTFTDAYGFCYGYHIMGGDNLTVTNSTISGCADGVSISSSATNVNIKDSLLLNNIYAAFWGGGVSNITFQNNTINGFYEGLGIEKSASQTYVINNTFINGWGNNSAQKASGDAIYIKNSYAHGPLSMIDDIQIIGNIFENIIGAAVGVDNQAGQGLFVGNGTGNSIVGVNNSVTNVSKGYVVLYSQGQNLNFTLDSSTPQAQPVFANLSISSASNNNTIKTGGSTTYTITVLNTGTGNATHVNVTNILNTLFFSSAQTYASIGNYANGIWNIGSLSAGNTASLVVTATALKSGTTSSQATVTSDTTTPVKAKTIQKTINKDVSVKIINSISTSNAKVGSYVFLRTNVTNSGKDTSDPMTFGMTLPSGVSTVSTNYPVQWNNKTKLWTLSVPSGKSIVLTTKVKVTTKGTKTVTFNNNGKKVTKSFKAT
ncbi:conserved repeat domain protein [Methanobacterium lacus]|uniref:Conserved repeat domain protein n=1 Tax=Methanobacterium lacus (strain AL-21) TaxID=877455 RepID=F0T776_METLA|nr:right-handed parallel beta-helix repeat-containing protein [Methanobacterium lacus]ADZ10710.1 conserved repeat domain protein [Methanobacterium lacus]